MSSSAFPPSRPTADFAARIIEWQRRHGRHALPWQQTRDPYRIWLSEIMLQQTQVTAVIPYYERFLQRFPDLQTLAEAPIGEVLEHWAGLGYYARARNLHHCAQQIMENHGGQFPQSPEALAQLAGIGRSTAAAIAAFAWGTRAAILDGNVKRVFCRHFGVEGYPGSTPVERELWKLADQLLPPQDMEGYTQGLMDMGATLCSRGRPACERCPVSTTCIARAEGRQTELPVAKPKKLVPEKSAEFLLVTDGQGILLERRPAAGIWGGLLVPPEGETTQTLAALGLAGLNVESLPAFSHTFTHFRLHLHPRLCRVDHPPLGDDARWHWLALEHVDSAALPAPIKRLLQRLRDDLPYLATGAASPQD